MYVNHTTNIEQAVERIVQPYVSKRRHAVLSIGILRGGERLVFGFGDLRPFGAVSCDNLIYEIGSITKVFTTSLLALLIAEGALRPDDSLGKFEPSLPGTHPVTLAHHIRRGCRVIRSLKLGATVSINRSIAIHTAILRCRKLFSFCKTCLRAKWGENFAIRTRERGYSAGFWRDGLERTTRRPSPNVYVCRCIYRIPASR